MTMHDDDPLDAYDLSAWDVPLPAPGLVDKVIERARQAAPVAALDSGERIATPVRAKRRWWIAAAAAAIATAVVLFGVWGVQRTPKDGQGEVAASAARTLALGPTTAALDPGAHVRWRRDKRRISVAQLRGAAHWKVGADDMLVIDAGAMVASVEASGASLRVEVEMLKSDARAVGISAATAVAVALVTIVVYEGTVRVRHDGQTVNIVPGARYEVRPANAPEPLTVGGGPADPRVRELEDQIKQLEGERDDLKKLLPQKTVDGTCDEVACVLSNYDGACCAKFKAQTPPKQADVPDTLTRAVITDAMQSVNAQILACPTDGFVGTVKLKVGVVPAGAVTRADVTATGKTVPDTLAACVERLVRTARFPITLHGGSFENFYAYTARATTCDADALRQQGDDHLGTGMDAAALDAFERSMQCKPDRDLHRKAYLAACRSKNAPKAQLHFAKLPAGQQGTLATICVRLGIDPGTPCDADLLKQQGDKHLGAGMDAAASASYEKSLECKQDPAVTRKAYMAACRSKNTVLARKHFATLPINQRDALAQICIRMGIDVDLSGPSGVIKVVSKPPAKILLDGVDTGQTTPATVRTTPGRHKITYVVANDKFTFAVTVKEGETVTLTKELASEGE